MSWGTPIRFLLNFIKSRWILLSCLLFAAIAVLSLTPLPQLPPTPGSDKTHHFIAYGSLMFPCALRRPKHWCWIGILFITLSGAIELLQPLVNRHMELADLAANSLGILCGVAAALLANQLHSKLDSP